MIRGNRPSAYGVTVDDKGRRIEVEFRQCQHCQTSWVYKPGSGNKRGFCFNCNGITCGRKACKENCAPFWEIAQEMSKNYILDLFNGIYVKK